MASNSEPSVPSFNFRDFLLYVVPGAVILASILLVSGVGSAQLMVYRGVTESVVALLASYLLGHVAYICSYPIRQLLPGWLEETDEWRNDHMWVLERHSAYYIGEVFRYRNLARMGLALVVPMLLFGASLCYRLWSDSITWAVAAAGLSAAAAVAMAYRAVRYNHRYLDQVSRCRRFNWNGKGPSDSETSP